MVCSDRVIPFSANFLLGYLNNIHGGLKHGVYVCCRHEFSFLVADLGLVCKWLGGAELPYLVDPNALDASGSTEAFFLAVGQSSTLRCPQKRFPFISSPIANGASRQMFVRWVSGCRLLNHCRTKKITPIVYICVKMYYSKVVCYCKGRQLCRSWIQHYRKTR